MLSKNTKRALLLINPVSGRKAILRHIPEVVRIFMDAGYLVTVMVTAERREAETLAKTYGQDFDLVVCAGGDGTMNETISGLAAGNVRVPLGYIPCGSTNDFAVSHGLSEDIPTAAHEAATGHVRIYDIGRFGDRYFTYVAAFGAFSSVSYNTDQNLKNRFGHAAYLMGGLWDLLQLKPTQLKLTADGAVYEGDFLLGAVCNTTSIGGTIELPESLVDPADGLLELLLVRMPETLVEMDDIVRGLLTQDYSSPLLELLRVKDITVETEEPLEWSLDGEASGAYKNVHICALSDFFLLQS